MRSMHMNKVELIGLVGNDIAVRRTSNGREFLILNLAVKEEIVSASSRSSHSMSSWHRVRVWEPLGVVLSQSGAIHRGSLVGIIGRLKTRSWLDGSGQRRYFTEVIAQDVKRL